MFQKPCFYMVVGLLLLIRVALLPVMQASVSIPMWALLYFGSLGAIAVLFNISIMLLELFSLRDERDDIFK
jgi:hypothetical protein